jgi:hypothetical protein
VNLEELKNKALQLSPEARAKLAHTLLASLETLSEIEIEQLWIDEAMRREAEIDAGKVSLRSADQVLKDARNRRR